MDELAAVSVPAVAGFLEVNACPRLVVPKEVLSGPQLDASMGECTLRKIKAYRLSKGTRPVGGPVPANLSSGRNLLRSCTSARGRPTRNRVELPRHRPGRADAQGSYKYTSGVPLELLAGLVELRHSNKLLFTNAG